MGFGFLDLGDDGSGGFRYFDVFNLAGVVTVALESVVATSGDH